MITILNKHRLVKELLKEDMEEVMEKGEKGEKGEKTIILKEIDTSNNRILSNKKHNYNKIIKINHLDLLMHLSNKKKKD